MTIQKEPIIFEDNKLLIENDKLVLRDFYNPDLQAYYHLESDGTDSSGNGYTMDIFNAPTFVAGKIGNCLNANQVIGQLKCVKTESELGIGAEDSISISLWVKIKNTYTGTDHPILAKNTLNNSVDFSIGINFTTSKFYVSRNRFNIQDVRIVLPDYTFDTWTHLALTYSSSSNLLKAYYNGVFVSSVETSGDGLNPGTIYNSRTTIGGSIFTGTGIGNNLVDEVRFYKGELRPDQILKIYNSEV